MGSNVQVSSNLLLRGPEALSAALAAVLEAVGWDLSGKPPERPNWHARAACRGQGHKAFFPATDDRRPGAESAYSAALTFCKVCPVVLECRRAGQHEAFGLWGGLSPAQRRRRLARAAN
ncbi:MAG TPA: WhiB family transcriptional regulator [Acidimicrobiales bacterium]|nr:WhiB family transcriptional regulator [Acidimicrobiales bacterium]